jgi:hypothetical protein
MNRRTSCLLILAMTLSAPAFGEAFDRYVNVRYGFSISYPSNMKADLPPENGDGLRFSNAEGFSIVASGINNIDNESLATEEKSLEGEFDVITYKTMGKSWVVLSGHKGSKILYIKAYVGRASINHLWITYPASVAADASATVSKVSASFKPGDLGELH